MMLELLTMLHDGTKLMTDPEADKGLKWVAMAGTGCGHGPRLFRAYSRSSFGLLPNSVSTCLFSLL